MIVQNCYILNAFSLNFSQFMTTIIFKFNDSKLYQIESFKSSTMENDTTQNHFKFNNLKFKV